MHVLNSHIPQGRQAVNGRIAENSHKFSPDNSGVIWPEPEPLSEDSIVVRDEIMAQYRECLLTAGEAFLALEEHGLTRDVSWLMEAVSYGLEVIERMQGGADHA